MMWTSRTEELADRRVLRIAIDLDASPVSYAEVLNRWRRATAVATATVFAQRPKVTDNRQAFDAITADPRYIANLDWGEARPGHPEGTVRAHIAEIEPNLEALKPKLTDDEYWKLKLLIHTHDSFKGESKQGVAITDPASHASIARAFLAAHSDDPDLQAMVQYHDEPFALYRQFESKGKYNQERFNALLKAIKDWN